MKVTITHLKAPWPAGVGVGHVVEFAAGSVPAWAAGKCTPAADDAEVFAVVEAPIPVATYDADLLGALSDAPVPPPVGPLETAEAQADAERQALADDAPTGRKKAAKG